MNVNNKWNAGAIFVCHSVASKAASFHYFEICRHDQSHTQTL